MRVAQFFVIHALYLLLLITFSSNNILSSPSAFGLRRLLRRFPELANGSKATTFGFNDTTTDVTSFPSETSVDLLLEIVEHELEKGTCQCDTLSPLVENSQKHCIFQQLKAAMEGPVEQEQRAPFQWSSSSVSANPDLPCWGDSEPGLEDNSADYVTDEHGYCKVAKDTKPSFLSLLTKSDMPDLSDFMTYQTDNISCASTLSPQQQQQQDSDDIMASMTSFSRPQLTPSPSPPPLFAYQMTGASSSSYWNDHMETVDVPSPSSPPQSMLFQQHLLPSSSAPSLPSGTHHQQPRKRSHSQASNPVASKRSRLRRKELMAAMESDLHNLKVQNQQMSILLGSLNEAIGVAKDKISERATLVKRAVTKHSS